MSVIVFSVAVRQNFLPIATQIKQLDDKACSWRETTPELR